MFFGDQGFWEKYDWYGAAPLWPGADIGEAVLAEQRGDAKRDL